MAASGAIRCAGERDLMKQKYSFVRLLSINSYWFGLSFLWNTLHPIVLPAILLNYVPETSKNTYLGLLTFAGLLLAMLIQPLSGALSDRSGSRWGKRRPFIAIGTIFDMGVLLALAFANSLLGIFLGYVSLQIASNIAQGPMQAVIPDLVPERQKGLASGIKNFMDMAGVISASVLAGILLDPASSNPLPVFLVVMGVLGFSAIITLLSIQDRQKGATSQVKEPVSLKTVFAFDRKAHPSFSNLLVSRFIFLLGVYGIQTFAQYYIRDVLAVENAVAATSSLMIVIAGTLTVSVLIAGWVTDRSAPERLMSIAMLVTAAGGLLLVFIQDMQTLMIVAGFIGVGLGLFLTSSWAMAVKLAPSDQAGRFLGLTNLATAGASAIGKLEGPLIDVANQMAPGLFLGYRFLFLFCFVCSLFGYFVFKTMNKRQEQAKGKNVGRS